MDYLYTVLFFTISFAIFFILANEIYFKKKNVEDRLEKIEKHYNEDIDLEDIRNKPFKDRIVKPSLEKIKNLIQKITPREVRNEIERNLKAANYPYGLGVDGWIALEVSFYIIIPFLFFLAIKDVDTLLKNKIFIFAVFYIICYFLPNVMLKSRIQMRQKKIIHQFPDILDLLTVSVEAGLSFDAAMSKVVEKAKGEMVSELQTVLNEIKLGVTRSEALRNMSQRMKISDINTFIFSVIQSEKMGVSISSVLKVQGAQARDKRRQAAREKAMKAPVKMLIPMVLFIFPAVFVIILGPAAIQMLEQLARG